MDGFTLHVGVWHNLRAFSWFFRPVASTERSPCGRYTITRDAGGVLISDGRKSEEERYQEALSRCRGAWKRAIRRLNLESDEKALAKRIEGFLFKEPLPAEPEGRLVAGALLSFLVEIGEIGLSDFERTLAGNPRVGALLKGLAKFGRRPPKTVWLARAMLTVKEYPDWSDARIARQVGVDKSRLSRSREYRTAATLARGREPPPRGWKTTSDKGRPRGLEAVDGGAIDPLREPSRASSEEEDLDSRIDGDPQGATGSATP